MRSLYPGLWGFSDSPSSISAFVAPLRAASFSIAWLCVGLPGSVAWIWGLVTDCGAVSLGRSLFVVLCGFSGLSCCAQAAPAIRQAAQSERKVRMWVLLSECPRGS